MSTLFDLDPVALVYPPGTSMREMKRCRECHRVTRSPNGGGWHKGGSYIVCEACFHDRGHRGELARKAWREPVEVTS